MIAVRPSNERGHVNHGWLDTYHTFSFASYKDPRHMGFRVLRVINEDCVAPGKGFESHPHHDMEIITYVLEGALEHRDSMGNGSVIRPGDVQHMSAGTGVTHSEFNHSTSEPVHLLQIWLFPKEKGIEPGWDQKTFPEGERLGRLRLIASPDGSEGSIAINQDAKVFASVLSPGDTIDFELAVGRHAWLQVARGTVSVNDTVLQAGDGAAISEEQRLTLRADESAEFLLFDLP